MIRNGSATSPSRYGSHLEAAAPTRYVVGDRCPHLVTGRWDREGDRWIRADPPDPCGSELEIRYGLRCKGLGHVVRQCPADLALLPDHSRSNQRYCSNRCRQAAHRRRVTAQAIAAAVTAAAAAAP